MKRYVLDSYALLAYCEGQGGAKAVADLLNKALAKEAAIFLCVVNWGEAYYITLREGGPAKADLFRSTLAKYPITLVNADLELTVQAARYKAHYKLSYADAFAAALAAVRKAALVTGDKEFEPLEGQIKIHWIE
jgi:ribonuclease VapC